MLLKYIKNLIRWMPIVFFILLFTVDRDNTIHKVTYIIGLLIFTGFTVLRILYAKKEWHKEFLTENLDKNRSLRKMSDLQDKLKENER